MKKDLIDFSKVNIRHAAGCTFLIDSEFDGTLYHKPIKINEVGEKIVCLLKDGRSAGDAAAALSAEYGIDQSEIRQDVDAFLASLNESYEVWR